LGGPDGVVKRKRGKALSGKLCEEEQREGAAPRRGKTVGGESGDFSRFFMKKKKKGGKERYGRRKGKRGGGRGDFNNARRVPGEKIPTLWKWTYPPFPEKERKRVRLEEKKKKKKGRSFHQKASGRPAAPGGGGEGQGWRLLVTRRRSLLEKREGDY